MKKENFEIYLFFKRGKLRKKVLDSLTEAKTATEIAKELRLHRSSVSRILLELEEKGFVKCLNPKDKNFRHYVKK
jgi:DNA-binding MarR family transcriptional regulator